MTGYVDLSSQIIPLPAISQFVGFFMIAITIIVVAVPEGLAMSVTLSLAYSMRKMTASNNLVRRMHACETIGAANVICSDKTGTLTKNEMRVVNAAFASMGDPGTPSMLVAEGIASNTTANLSRLDGEPARGVGNPTESALLLWLEDAGIDYIDRRDDFDIAYQWTFTAERKYMATLGESKVTQSRVLNVKGAPEILLDRCGSVLTATGPAPIESYRAEIESALCDSQAKGMRTLGLSYRDFDGDHDGVDIAHLVTDMTWLGFFSIADPIREEVPEAIATCRRAGIDVKIVTGDNAATAEEIARQIGLLKDGDPSSRHMTGAEFGAMSDEEAAQAVLELKVLSRARPMDKLRLVKLLKAAKQVVAVTGDGTNDAPALNYADVGLAMGKSGTAVAKEASDIILLDDSFGTIVNAVMWGRSLYENIQRFILFQLTVNVAALLIALLGPFLGIGLPLTVIQMLWVNLIMDTFAALALATEPPHPDVLDRQPRSYDAFIVTKSMAKNIFAIGGIFVVVLVTMIFWVKAVPAASPEYGYRLTVFYATFVMLQFWNLFNARCLGHNHSAFHRISENKSFAFVAAVIFVGQILMVQFGGELFRTVPLAVADWALIIGSTSLVLVIGEILRAVSRSKHGASVPA
jgi:Ca2+-transporting ATPase